MHALCDGHPSPSYIFRNLVFTFIIGATPIDHDFRCKEDCRTRTLANRMGEMQCGRVETAGGRRRTDCGAGAPGRSENGWKPHDGPSVLLLLW